MKKIILIIVIALCIFQMVVLAVSIDIGEAAIDRDSSQPSGNTYISKVNPANASGIINKIEIWANEDLENCEVAIFDDGLYAYTYTTRSYTTIGNVTAGAKRTFDVNLEVEEGDYIGLYFTAGSIEWSDIYPPEFGVVHQPGDQIPCEDVLFGSMIDGIISLYGTGIIVEGWYSPTDGSGVDWSDIPNAYDENTGTYATIMVSPATWSETIELTIDSLLCDKVRFWAYYFAGLIESIDLDVYYDDDWHDIYEGAYANNEWVEKSLGGTYSVTKARMKFYNAGTASLAFLNEFDFHQVVAEVNVIFFSSPF